MAIRGQRRVDKLAADIYANLDPAERVRLVLTRSAEGQEDEARRIARACPRKRYEEPDVAYTDRMDRTRCIANLGASFIDRHAALLGMAEAQRELLETAVDVMVSLAMDHAMAAYLADLELTVAVNFAEREQQIRAADGSWEVDIEPRSLRLLDEAGSGR